MKHSVKRLILILIYLVIFLSCATVVTLSIVNGPGSGQVGNDMAGWGFLKAFTPDSNILCAIFSLMSLIYVLKNKSAELPRALQVFNLMGTVAVTLTFLVVLLFLAPVTVMKGGSYFTLFAGNMFHLHFFNPALAVAAFVLSSSGTRFTAKEISLGLVPTAVYSVFYVLFVVVLKSWNDFYSFTWGGSIVASVISFFAVYGVTLLISYLLSLICRRKSGK